MLKSLKALKGRKIEAVKEFLTTNLPKGCWKKVGRINRGEGVKFLSKVRAGKSIIVNYGYNGKIDVHGDPYIKFCYNGDCIRIPLFENPALCYLNPPQNT